MVGGIERYFQIAKCFRDEDLRADRQPEFTQVDIEMSFVDENDVRALTEKLIAKVFKEIKGIDISLPLKQMKYDDAIKYYGSDKPDLRFDLIIQDVTNVFKNTEITFIKDSVLKNGVVNAILIPNSASHFTRKEIDKCTEFVRNLKASGLMYIKMEEELSGSIVKNLTDTEKEELIKALDLKKEDIAFLVVGEYKIVKNALGALRCKIAKDLNLIKKNDYKLLWVTDFPTFEYSE